MKTTLAPRRVGGGPAPVGTGYGQTTFSRRGALATAQNIVNTAQSPMDIARAGKLAIAAVVGINTTAAAQVAAYVRQAERTSTSTSPVSMAYRKQWLTYAIMWAGIALTGAGVAGLPTRVGMGDLNVNDTQLGVTASALMSNLNSAGCQQAFSQPVSDFQSAYNAAGGTPALTVDGLYGALTQAALQQAINGLPSPIGLTGATAPAGCVAAASSSAGQLNVSPTVVPGSAPSSSSASIAGTDLVPLAIAGVAAAGLIGLAIYAKKKKGFRIIHRRPVHHGRHAYR
jgi:hypothetical protein